MRYDENGNLDCENCPYKDICERPCGWEDDGFEPLHD